MDKRLLQRVRGIVSHLPAVTSGSTPVVGAVIDRLGANGALARSMLIAVTNAVHTGGTVSLALTIQDGETNSPATAVTLSASLPAIDCATGQTTLYQLDLEGFGRYFKITSTPTPTASGVVYQSIALVLGDMDINPEATPAIVYKKA